MPDRINTFTSIQQMQDQLKNKGSVQSRPVANAQGLTFEQVLKSKTGVNEGLRFSKHANERLMTRNIDLTAEQIGRLENGVNKAEAKGIRESLVMVDDLAFIVNVKNNMVITAVNNMDENVFTNIDGAVIA